MAAMTVLFLYAALHRQRQVAQARLPVAAG